MKDLDKLCVDGHMKLPKGTVCTLRQGWIYYQTYRVCRFTSETRKEYFCLDLDEVEERKALLETLLPMRPKNPKMWSKSFEKLGLTNVYNWKPFIMKATNEQLKQLIFMIQMEGERA